MGAVNLVTNPDFEVDLTGWNFAGFAANLTRSTAQFHSGIASCALTPAALGQNYIWPNVGNYLQPIQGRQYVAAWWVRLPTALTYTTEVGDANGDWSVAGPSVPVAANTWTEIIVPFTAGPWVPGDEFILRMNRPSGNFDGETVYYDDIFIALAGAIPDAYDLTDFPKYPMTGGRPL